jgi:CRP/FNR family transcriptional regulator
MTETVLDVDQNIKKSLCATAGLRKHGTKLSAGSFEATRPARPCLLEAIGRLRPYPANRSIFEEGEEADYAYKVCSGNVRLSKLLPDGRRQITGFVTSGSLIGYLGRKEYSYNAETIDDVVLCHIPTTKLQRALEKSSALLADMLSIRNDELAAAQDQMLLLGRKNAREKLAAFLLSRVESTGHARVGAAIAKLPMSRSDVADYLGLSPETVSRIFSMFVSTGMIEEIDRNSVRICDVAVYCQTFSPETI